MPDLALQPGSKPGIYALISLDGAPLSPRDRDALGLRAGVAGVHELPGAVVRACGSPALVSATHIYATPDVLLAFAGYLDEPEDLARTLGIFATARCSPAELSHAALDRFGPDAPWHMLGEWSLLRWSAQAKELTLLTSENQRDPFFWTVGNPHSGAPGRIAIAPDMLLLGRLPWVGLTLNPEGLALQLSRAGLRRIRGRETVWQSIYAAQPATREVFHPVGHHSIAPAPEPTPQRFVGSFDDAVEALNTLGRHIVGQNMRRYGSSAFLLSGGIDSTLLAAFGAQEHNESSEVFCLTSAASEGSNLRDEREFSLAAAQQLGLSVRLVTPGPDACVYRPSERSFVFTGEPSVSIRHYLYDALRFAAAQGGANALFDGVAGEMSITEKPEDGFGVDWLHRIVYAFREWRGERHRRASWPAGGFHARLAPEFLYGLPASWRQPWREASPRRPQPRRMDPRGIHPALSKIASAETSTPEGVRRLFPFRDRRLIRFAAGLPYGYGEHDGQSRAMARAMLAGRVPDSVRLRSRGMPFSPDYELRIRVEARAARERIPLFREAGVERWLDLDWLSAALDRLSSGADAYALEQSQAQFTAMAAEFLLWCRSGGIAI